MALGVIDECSLRGVWFRYIVRHNFFVIINSTRVDLEYKGHITYYKEPFDIMLSDALNHRVLLSGYKARPTKPLSPFRDHIFDEGDIGRPPMKIPSLAEKDDFVDEKKPTLDMEENL